jgi:hypothetical protein
MIQLNQLEAHLKEIPTDKWDRLFALAEKMEKGSNLGVQVSGERLADADITLVSFTNASIVDEFLTTVYELDIAPSFDSSDWKREYFDPLQSGTADLSKADAVTICKCLTVILRGERMSDGFASSMVKNGFIPKLIKALQAHIKSNVSKQKFLELCIFQQKKYAEIEQILKIDKKTIQTWYEELRPVRERMAKVKTIHGRKNMAAANLMAFFNWYEGRSAKCEYCGVTEQELALLNQNEQMINKRTTRGRTLELDRKKPNEPYDNLDNLVMCCYWCNNAKTDTFTHDEFKIVGEAIGSVWKNRLNHLR